MFERYRNNQGAGARTKKGIGFTAIAGPRFAGMGERKLTRQIEHHVTPVVGQINTERTASPKLGERPIPPVTLSAVTEIAERFKAMRGGKTGLEDTTQRHLARSTKKQRAYRAASRLGTVTPLHDRLTEEESAAFVEAGILGGMDAIADRWKPAARPAQVKQLKNQIIQAGIAQGNSEETTRGLMRGRGLMRFYPYIVADHFGVSATSWARQSRFKYDSIPPDQIIPTEVVQRANVMIQLPDDTLDRLIQLDANIQY